MRLSLLGRLAVLGLVPLFTACTATLRGEPLPDGAAPDLPLRDDDASRPRDAAVLDAASPFDADREDMEAADAGATDAPAPEGGTAVDAGPSDAGSTCAARPYLGLYVWSDTLVTRRDAILELAEAQGVTEIYLHANLFYAGDEEPSVLAAWIGAAQARCIAVDLLFGNAAWIRPATQIEATARTRWAVDFAAAHPDTRPSGVHFDLEPQQLPEWHAMPTDRPLWIDTLAGLLETMTPVAEAGGLPLSLDMGFFIDGYDVTRGAITRPGHEWLIDAVSRVVVMDYRDSAASRGFGGMISLAMREVAYAGARGRPIVLAVETQPVTPEYVTFFEEGLTALHAELALTRAAFAAEPLFRGFAIHDEEGLAALRP